MTAENTGHLIYEEVFLLNKMDPMGWDYNSLKFQASEEKNEFFKTEFFEFPGSWAGVPYGLQVQGLKAMLLTWMAMHFIER